MAKQIHCQVGLDAKEVLVTYQKHMGFSQQGDALESLLLKFHRMNSAIAERKEAENHIDELIED